MNPGGHRDDPFDKDLQQVGDAYREIHPEDPPAMLDQAVLSRARRAVESKSVRPWNFGWIHALTTAALVVLAVGIVLQMPRRQAGPEPLPATTEQADQRARESIQARRSMTEPDALEQAQEEVLTGTEDRLESFAQPAVDRQDVPADPDTAAPGQPEAAGVGTSLAEEAEVEGVRDTAEADMAPALPYKVSVPAKSMPVAAPEPPMETGDDAGEPLAETVVTGASLEDAEAGMEKAEMTAEVSQDAYREQAARFAAAANAQPAPEPPEAWLERIRALLAEGEIEDSKAELEAFRSAWPDYELPPDLAAALEQGVDD